MAEEQGYHTDQEKSKGREENWEEKSDNASEHPASKRQLIELQGEFRKIKPPHFDGKLEEDAEAWLINMNKYFQLYEYSHNLKAWL